MARCVRWTPRELGTRLDQFRPRYARQGLRVNAVLQGFTDTLMLSAMSAEQKAAFAAQYIPMRGLSKPEEITAPTVWLCSESAPPSSLT